MSDQYAWQAVADQGDPMAKWVVGAKDQADFAKRRDWAIAHQDQDKPGFVPPQSYDTGGGTPHATGPLPDGGHPAVVHPKEWVSNPTGRALLGDAFLAASDKGTLDLSLLPHFGDGGPTDDPLGPTGAAPNTGGIGAAIGAALGGAQGALGNLMPGKNNPAAGAGIPGVAPVDPLLGMPGLWGLVGASRSQDPAAAGQLWSQQTMGWLANWGLNTLGTAASDLYSGVLGFFGAGNSVLSPSNPWTSAALKAGTGILSRFGGAGGGEIGTDANSLISGKWGPLLASLGGLGGANPTVGNFLQTGALDPADAKTAGPLGAGGQTIAGMTPGAVGAISYAQQHALGQPYQYGGVGDAAHNFGYDCSGIASSIYAAAKGLPEGTRYFTTESDFAALGFVPGFHSGDLNIGVMRGGGGPNSHMVLTLPNGINVESGGAADTTQYGGKAKGATDLPLQWHLPLAGNQGVGSVPGLYDAGGPWPTGTVGYNMSGKTETVLTHDQTQDMHAALTATAQQINSTAQAQQQNSKVQAASPSTSMGPDAQHMQPPAPKASTQPAQPTQPALSPLGPQNQPQAGAPAQGGQGPQKKEGSDVSASTDHVLPALKTGIMSTASTLGNIAGMAASAAAAGASGGAGGAAGGSIGSLVSGLFNEGGKIAVDIANVPSSLLVGTLTDGTTANPSGQTYHPPQEAAATANIRTTNYNGGINGHSVEDVKTMLDLRESQEQQSHLANYRGPV
jgi:hypothetical protein